MGGGGAGGGGCGSHLESRGEPRCGCQHLNPALPGEGCTHLTLGCAHFPKRHTRFPDSASSSRVRGAPLKQKAKKELPRETPAARRQDYALPWGGPLCCRTKAQGPKSGGGGEGTAHQPWCLPGEADLMDVTRLVGPQENCFPKKNHTLGAA